MTYDLFIKVFEVVIRSEKEINSLFDESGLHILKKVEFLPLLILHDLSIDIVGEVSGPLDEGALVRRDALEADLTVDSSGTMSWLDSHYFVSNLEVSLTELGHANLPDCIVSELHAHDTTDLSLLSLESFAVHDMLRADFVKLPLADVVPHGLNVGSEHRALDAGSTARHH